MFTAQQAYDNWQAVIRASCQVEVDAAKLHICTYEGIPILEHLKTEVHEHISNLRQVLDAIEQGLDTIPMLAGKSMQETAPK